MKINPVGYTPLFSIVHTLTGLDVPAQWNVWFFLPFLFSYFVYMSLSYDLVLLCSPNSPSDFFSQARILFNFAIIKLIIFLHHVSSELTFLSLHRTSGYLFSASRTTQPSTTGTCWRARTSCGASKNVPCWRRESQLTDEVLARWKKGAGTDDSPGLVVAIPASSRKSPLTNEVLAP
jgi:hypothetical protein